MKKGILIWLVLGVIALLSISCSVVSRKKPPVIAPQSAKTQFLKIKKNLKMKNRVSSIKNLKSLISRYPDSDIVDDSWILIGDIYFSLKKYKDSFDAYMSVSQSEFFSPQEADSLLRACKSLYKLGGFDEALALSGKALKFAEKDKELLPKIHSFRYSLQAQMGDNLDALLSLLMLSKLSTDPGKKRTYQEKAIDFLDSRLSEKEVEIIAGDDDYGALQAYAKFQIATRKFEEKDYSSARSLFKDVVEILPDSDITEQSEKYLEQIEAQRKVHPMTIGAILPLSGRHSKMAYKTLRGLQLGLGIYGKHRSNFKLAVIDSEGNPDVARRAVERLVIEDHVIAIVGSLLSKTSVAVASKADELGVPSIALSQKSGITDVGENVFRNALTSDLQVQKLVETAMNEYGFKRFAILYPNDRYGVEYANLFWNHVLARGGEIRGAQAYDGKKNDFGGPIQRLVGTYYLEDRRDEYQYNLTEWMMAHKTNSRVSPPADLLPPNVDFDAIFIPDTVKKVQQIAPTLSFYDVDGVKLLGTNLWNSPRLTQRSREFVEGSLFVDSLLDSSSSFKRTNFYHEFRAVFGYSPGTMESQAYDSALILRQIISSGEASRIGLAENLSKREKFSGSLGELRITPRREILRPVISLMVSEGKIEPLQKKSEKE